MQLLVKILVSSAIIVICSFAGKKVPSLAGLIVVMPVTGITVIILLSIEGGQKNHLVEYSRGALFGVFPTFLFYITTLICLKINLPLSITLLISSVLWIFGAVTHQLVLN